MEYACLRRNRDWQESLQPLRGPQLRWVDQVVINDGFRRGAGGVFRASRYVHPESPQGVFVAGAPGLAVGMSARLRDLAILGWALNAGTQQQGSECWTGAAMGKVGEGIFGEGTTRAPKVGEVSDTSAEDFQLSNASKVAIAMRTGLAFQAGMGFDA
jgi:hypothetical protein